MNYSDRTIKVLQLINGKPCCGRVGPISDTSLDPGEVGKFEVTIIPGQTIGDLSHWAVVETDHPEARELEFWTLAKVVPRLSIRAKQEGVLRLSPNIDTTLHFEYIKHATGSEPTPTDPPTIACSNARSKARWDGAPTMRQLQGGLTEWSSPFLVKIEAGNAIGPKQTEIRVASPDGSESVSAVVQWEVMAAIETRPGRIAVPRDQTMEQTVLLSSTSDERFAVLDVRSDIPGLEATCRTGGTAAKRHAIDIKSDPSRLDAGHQLGMLRVRTDSKTQPNVSIPIVVIGP